MAESYRPSAFAVLQRDDALRPPLQVHEHPVRRLRRYACARRRVFPYAREAEKLHHRTDHEPDFEQARDLPGQGWVMELDGTLYTTDDLQALDPPIELGWVRQEYGLAGITCELRVKGKFHTGLLRIGQRCKVWHDGLAVFHGKLTSASISASPEEVQVFHGADASSRDGSRSSPATSGATKPLAAPTPRPGCAPWPRRASRWTKSTAARSPCESPA